MTTYYGFLSKKYLNRVRQDDPDYYGTINIKEDGSLVVCTQVSNNKKPFNNYDDNHHHGVIIGFARFATYEDVKDLIDKPQTVENPAKYFK